MQREPGRCQTLQLVSLFIWETVRWKTGHKVTGSSFQSCDLDILLLWRVHRKPAIKKTDAQTEQGGNFKYVEIVCCLWSNLMKMWQSVNQVAWKDTW